MTFDQKIQIWNTVGAWLAMAATFLAVLVSLHLARRAEKIKIKASVGIRIYFEGDGSPAKENVGFTVTNHADRPVTINSIGWRVGKGKGVNHCGRVAQRVKLWV